MIYFLSKITLTKLTRCALIIICSYSCFNGHNYTFFRESDEVCQLSAYRTFENNRLLLNNSSQISMAFTAFDTDSFALIIDSSASSLASPHKYDYAEGTYKALKG